MCVMCVCAPELYRWNFTVGEVKLSLVESEWDEFSCAPPGRDWSVQVDVATGTLYTIGR